ncbi:MAG: hypothetical protein ACKOA9_03645 [Actinomycetota bacterium]
MVPAAGGPLPVTVRAAADAAAESLGDAWRAAGWATRVRSLPGAATEALERLLDRIVKTAIEDPVPVHDADQVVARLETDSHPPPFGGALLLALAARSRRTLTIGRRAVPLALTAKLGTDVVGSFRLGAYELELLASQVVNRMRAARVPVDPRTVQRVTVNAYLAPRRRHDVDAPRRSAAARLAGMWVGRIMAVEPAVGRIRKAAELVDELDFVAARPRP